MALQLWQGYEALAAPERIHFLASMISTCTKPELLFAEKLTAHALKTAAEDEEAPSTSGEDRGAARAAAQINSVQWITALSGKSRDLMQTVHTITELLPHLEADSHQASTAIFDIIVHIPWHPGKDHPNEAVMCEPCLTALQLCECHPAFSDQQSESLANLRRQLMASSTSYPSQQQPQQQGQPQPQRGPSEPLYTSSMGPATALVGIKVVATQKIRKDHAFVMDVAWNNGSSTRALRTYDDFFNFQCELLDLFPNEAAQKPRPIPYLPGKKLLSSFNRSKREFANMRMPGIQAYVQALIRLPHNISRCQHVIKFFLSDSIGGGLRGETEAGFSMFNSANKQQQQQQQQQQQAALAQHAMAPVYYVAMPTQPHPHQAYQMAAAPSGAYHQAPYPYVYTPSPPVYQAMPQPAPQPRAVATPRSLSTSPTTPLTIAAPTMLPAAFSAPSSASTENLLATDEGSGDADSVQSAEYAAPSFGDLQAQVAKLSQSLPDLTEGGPVRRYDSTTSLSSIAEEAGNKVYSRALRPSKSPVSSIKRAALSESNLTRSSSVGSVNSLGGGGKCCMCKIDGHASFECPEPTISAADMVELLQENKCPAPEDASQADLTVRCRQFTWLKSLRLHKYAVLLLDLPLEGILKLSDEYLKGKGMTAGAMKKLRNKLDTAPPDCWPRAAQALTPDGEIADSDSWAAEVVEE